MDLISVIVPVYKVEKYLDRCVQSIVDQTYRNLEIILVDDGSPDNCPAMCDAWAEKDSRIKVIHKENGGGAQARNVGIDYAKGQLIGFVDSDDFIQPNMYQYLYQILMETNCDIAECSFFTTDSDNSFKAEHINETLLILNTEDALKEHIHDRICRQLVWNKLYRRKSIDDIRMVEGKFIDDEFFTYRVLSQAGKVVVSNQKLYAYRQHPDSVMHKNFTISRLQAVDAKCQRLEFLKSKFPNLVSVAKINLWYTCLYMGQMALLFMEKTERLHAFKILEDVMKQYPLSSDEMGSLSYKQKVWALLSNISFTSTCKLRNCLHIGI